MARFDAQSSASAPYPKHVFVPFTTTPVAHTNWASFVQSSSRYFGGEVSCTGAVANDEINFDVLLGAGTWTLDLIHEKAADVGVYTILIDAVALGTTVDGYAASSAAARDSITGIVVAASGVKRVTLRMTSKNASSSAFKGRLSALSFTRTA